MRAFHQLIESNAPFTLFNALKFTVALICVKERDEATQGSSLYSLSDFGTSGEKAARKHDDYMKKYFISQYGAIKDIDFTPIFESLVLADEVK